MFNLNFVAMYILRSIHVYFLLLIIHLTGFGQTKQAGPFNYKLVQVSEGIYVSQRPEPLRETVDGNFTIIINENDVVVIDASLAPSEAKLIIADIKRLTDKPIKYLINTHFHGDHTFGNQTFKNAYPGIEIIATRETANVMETRTKTFKSIYSNDSIFQARQSAVDSQIIVLRKNGIKVNEKIISNLQLFRDEDIYILRDTYKELVITPPTLIFEKELVFKRGDREMKVMFLGKGDTPGDAWVYLPKEKILICGDALPHPLPFGFSSTPVEWIATLQKAVEIDFDILIPGHGDVQYDKRYMQLVIQLLQSVYKHVSQSIEKGQSLKDIENSLQIHDLEKAITNGDPFLQYYFDEYFKTPIVGRFYNDIVKNKKP